MSGPEFTEVEEPFIDQLVLMGWKPAAARSIIGSSHPVLDPVRPPQVPACGVFTLCRPEVR